MVRAKPEKVQIKTLKIEQIPALIAPLHAASWRVAYRGIFDDAFLDNEADAERLQHWRARVPALIQGVGEIFLATIAGVPAGFLCIEIGPQREWGAYVDNLHMLPHLRGHGVGKLLVAAASEWAIKNGEHQLYLRVFEDNKQARQFYAREGWREVAREIEEVPGGGNAAMLVLVKTLPSR